MILASWEIKKVAVPFSCFFFFLLFPASASSLAAVAVTG